MQISEELMDYQHVEEYKLSNGLSVWMNEDHSQPKVFGAIVVKAGAKNCPNTGIAHYFEHMMFKGTDKIGTVDYESEKAILELIAEEYDILAKTTDAKKRNHLLRIINELSIKAADYVVPNEFDNLITRFGGTSLNAGTSYDFTAYFNSFTPQYMEQWAEINSERMINPVFRLFQNELETVYEEKNMQNDKLGSLAIEKLTERFFYPHPYAYPIIGSTENLKNPSIRAMRQFFEDYYVAGNMGVILSGDFNAKEVLPIFERYFSRIRPGVAPDTQLPPPPPFHGRETIQIKYMVPLLRIMAIGFRGVPANHPDKIALNIVTGLLNNSNGTGMLDKLTVDHKVVATIAINESMNDAGILGVLAMPRLFFQSYTSVEKLIFQQIDRIKKGDFTDELFQNLKLEEKRDYQTSIEEIPERAKQMIRIFSQGKHWQDFMDEVQRIDSLTKQDVMDVAQRYFGEDYLFVTKTNGNYPKEKLPKPSYQPVVPKHIGENSPYVKQLMQGNVRELQPRFIDFKNDVRSTELSLVKLYANTNPVNDIFSMDLFFGIGSIEQPLLMQMCGYLSFLTIEGMSFEQYHQKLQALGSVVNFGYSDSDFKVSITGFDNHFDETLELVGAFFRTVKNDESKLSHVMDESKILAKTFAKSNDSLSDALNEKIMYGEQSRYLKVPSLRQLKKMSGSDFIELFKNVLHVECIVCYTGRLPMTQVRESMERILPLGDIQRVSNSPFVRPFVMSTDPTVYYLNLPEVSQNVLTVLSLTDLIRDDYARNAAMIFASYFGGGMQSVMFQELREMRSFAYQVGAHFNLPLLKNNDKYPASFYAQLSTQKDKTVEALDVLLSLLNDMPVDEDRLEVIKQLKRNQMGTDYPPFRMLSQRVASLTRLGYQIDPLIHMQQTLSTFSCSDLNDFYLHHIKDHPKNFAIVGNLSKEDLKNVEKFGKVVQLSIKDVFNM